MTQMSPYTVRSITDPKIKVLRKVLKSLRKETNAKLKNFNVQERTEQ